jgi:hypothetical protein
MIETSGTAADAARAGVMVDAVMTAIMVAAHHHGQLLPIQDGDLSLWATACAFVAGDLAAGCGDDVRGSFVEHLQTVLMKAAAGERL